jgi:O-antigen biosynthesis protein
MTELNPLKNPIFTTIPRRLTAGSGWHEHIPFGMLLVDLLRPGIFVELGTHYGDSYCTFCQAVLDLRLDTRCFAVDTWVGDAHSGTYGEDVLADLRSAHDPLYSGFSQLVRLTFDEAATTFEDGTIDLLHIDGYHTYEAVSHDFQTWLPRMSRRGVVLFHDTNVRDKDFGVWRFWEEVRARYPHFEFVHGHGLGVLGVGSALPPGASLLFALPDDEANALRALCSEMGHRLTLRTRNAGLEARLKDLEDWGRKVDAECQLRGEALDALRTTYAQAEEQLRASQGRSEEIEARFKEVETECEVRGNALDALRAAYAQAEQRVRASDARSQEIEARFKEVETECQVRGKTLEDVSARFKEAETECLVRGQALEALRAAYKQAEERLGDAEHRAAAVAAEMDSIKRHPVWRAYSIVRRR